MPETIRIIFMGTPEFAVPSLEILIQSGMNVVAVITAPDKPQGRGQKIVYSPVKECALKYNVPVLQPTNLKSPDFQQQLKDFNADLQIVVAFRMLPEAVWAMPVIGTFNLHASLLPDYRGAAPINWAIINGEKETGVTTFFLEHDIDTGSIIFQEKEIIHADDTAGTLYERLMNKGAQLVLKTAQAIASKNYTSKPQGKSAAEKHAPKIFKETCEINWTWINENVVNFVRGLNPYPSAWSTLEGKFYKIHKVSAVSGSAADKSPGSITTDHKNFLHIQTGLGSVSIEDLQPEGKRKMTIQEFFRGNKL
jgi:methionyl-tRNA formyltransferase